ncbi:chaperonin-like RbcX protein 2, chloroplastic [Actinidia eriantha]|uniref:chaperonin-like RbcX protein 2, chloroplastic n=1 Tax=Actinidia eriantha TaxID=165200 RepID=UPI00258795A9|nr:chaperonin-like RbcX protein 2, chloroplastic [Actinidia eriantha]
MVGALSVVGSSVVDSHTSPYLCLDALPSSNLIHRNSGDLVLKRNSNDRKKHLVIRSSFTSPGYQWRPLAKAKNSKKLRRARSLVVVNELAGQYEDSFEDVKSQILNYFTYKAVRTVLNQLYEMNPTQYRWFYDFVAANKPGDGKRFIRTLVKEKQELAERVMVTRLHLYGKWVKKCNHAEIYNEISDQNLELMRERLMETVIWPSDDTNMEKIG